jgi:hypothetical protein
MGGGGSAAGNGGGTAGSGDSGGAAGSTVSAEVNAAMGDVVEYDPLLNAQPAELVSLSNGDVLSLWVALEIGGDRVHFAPYSGATGTWAAPAPADTTPPADLGGGTGIGTGGADDIAFSFAPLANGGGVLVWSRLDPNATQTERILYGSLYQATYTPGSGFSDPTAIFGDQIDSYAPTLAVGGDGSVFITFLETAATGDTTTHLLVSRRAPGSATWDAPLDLGSYTDSNIVADGAGNALVRWTNADITNVTQEIRRYVAGTGWQAAQAIPNSSPMILGLYGPVVAMNAAGQAVMLFSLDYMSLTVVSFDPATGLGPTMTLASSIDASIGIDVAINASGVAAAVAQGNDGNVFAFTRGTDGTWSDKINLGAPGHPPVNGYVDGGPHVTIDSSGQATVVFPEPMTTGGANRIFVSRFAGTAVLFTEAVDDGHTPPATAPLVAADPAHGQEVVTWLQGSPTDVFSVSVTP